MAWWNPQILMAYPQSIALNPQFSILNASFSILQPQISLIKPQVSIFISCPSILSQKTGIFYSKVLKIARFRQNVRKRRLHRLQLFLGLTTWPPITPNFLLKIPTSNFWKGSRHTRLSRFGRKTSLRLRNQKSGHRGHLSMHHLFYFKVKRGKFPLQKITNKFSCQ